MTTMQRFNYNRVIVYVYIIAKGVLYMMLDSLCEIFTIITLIVEVKKLLKFDNQKPFSLVANSTRRLQNMHYLNNNICTNILQRMDLDFFVKFQYKGFLM